MFLARIPRRWSRTELFLAVSPLLLLVLGFGGIWYRTLSAQRLLSVAYLPDGNFLCAYSDAHVVLRDGQTGHDLKTIRKARSTQALGFAVSRDGQSLVVPGRTQSEVAVLSTPTGKVKYTLPSSTATTYISFSPDGASAALHTRGTNTFVDIAKGVQRNVLIDGGANCVLEMRDQSTCVAALNDTIRNGTLIQLGVRSTITGKWLHSWKHDAAPVHALTLSNNGRIVAVASHKPYTQDSALPIGITLYDVSTGQTLHTLQPLEDFGRLAFSPDGTRLAASLDGTKQVYVWDVKTGNQLFKIDHQSAFNFIRSLSVAWSPDGSTLLTASSNDQLCLWDGHTGRQKQFGS